MYATKYTMVLRYEDDSIELLTNILLSLETEDDRQ